LKHLVINIQFTEVSCFVSEISTR